MCSYCNNDTFICPWAPRGCSRFSCEEGTCFCFDTVLFWHRVYELWWSLSKILQLLYNYCPFIKYTTLERVKHVIQPCCSNHRNPMCLSRCAASKRFMKLLTCLFNKEQNNQSINDAFYDSFGHLDNRSGRTLASSQPLTDYLNISLTQRRWQNHLQQTWWL